MRILAINFGFSHQAKQQLFSKILTDSLDTADRNNPNRMKVFPSIAFLFAFQQQEHHLRPGHHALIGTSSCSLLFSKNDNNIQDVATTTTTTEDLNVKIQDLLSAIVEVGQVGSMASDESRSRMEDLAKALVNDSDAKPARYPLKGEHVLLYSAAPGGSSGRLFGNVYGKVTQIFEDDDIFYNTVNLGPITIALKARREIMNDTAIKVTFLETTVSVFGKQVVQKEISGGGVWKYLFLGKIQDADGNKKLLRVMETPSLFVIEQPL